MQIKVNYFEAGRLREPRSYLIPDDVRTGYKSRSCYKHGEEQDNQKVEVKVCYKIRRSLKLTG